MNKPSYLLMAAPQIRLKRRLFIIHRVGKGGTDLTWSLFVKVFYPKCSCTSLCICLSLTVDAGGECFLEIQIGKLLCHSTVKNKRQI